LLAAAAGSDALPGTGVGLSAFREPLLRAVHRPEDVSGQVRAQSDPLFWWAGDLQAPADRVDTSTSPRRPEPFPGSAPPLPKTSRTSSRGATTDPRDI
jgi:hypothetical protein